MSWKHKWSSFIEKCGRNKIKNLVDDKEKNKISIDKNALEASNVNISGPYNFSHETHIDYDWTKNQFTGVPEAFLQMLRSQIRFEKKRLPYLLLF